MAAGYRRQFFQELGITDVSDMSAAQIEQSIIRIRAKRLARIDQRAVFDQSRQKLVQRTNEVHSEWKQEDEAATKDAGLGSKFDTNQSQYSPLPRDYYQRAMYNNRWNSVGWGFFW
jgi:hypothetical protein